MALLTVQTQHLIVQQAIQRVSRFGNRYFEPSEIDLQLNRAMFKIIDSILDDSSKEELLDKGFDFSKINATTISPIKIVDFEIPINNIDVQELQNNKLKIEISFYNIIKGSVKYKIICNNKEKEIEANIRLMSSEDIDYHKSNPFTKSNKESFIGELAENKIILYTVSNIKSIESVKISYIRNPKRIFYSEDDNGNFSEDDSVSCELGDNCHYLITDIAIAQFKKIMEANPNIVQSFEKEKLI